MTGNGGGNEGERCKMTGNEFTKLCLCMNHTARFAGLKSSLFKLSLLKVHDCTTSGCAPLM